MHDLLLIGFEGTAAAGAVLERLRALDDARAVDLQQAAVVVRHADGTAEVPDREEGAPKRGSRARALAGILVSALGSTLMRQPDDTVARALMDLEIDAPYVAQVADLLRPGTSALVAVADLADLDAVLAQLDDVSGIVLNHSLDPERLELVEAALETPAVP